MIEIKALRYLLIYTFLLVAWLCGINGAHIIISGHLYWALLQDLGMVAWMNLAWLYRNIEVINTTDIEIAKFKELSYMLKDLEDRFVKFKNSSPE